MVSAVRLNALLDDLDRAGLDAGPAARQQAHMLYMLLASDPNFDTPNAERRLVDHLRPLIIRSREQSDAFERVVLQWGVSAPGMETLSSGATEAIKAAAQSSTALPKPTRSFPIPIPWMVGAFAIMFLAFWGLTRLTEPAPVVSTPVVAGPSGPTQSNPGGPTTVVEAPEEIVERVEETNQSADLDFDSLLPLVVYQFMRWDYAPTLRELHSTDLFGEIELDEVRRLTGLRPDQPMPLNGNTLRRLVGAAVLQIQTSENRWRELMRDNTDIDESWPLDAEERKRAVEQLARSEARTLRRLGIPDVSEDMIERVEDAADAFSAIEALAKSVSPPSRLVESEGALTASFSPDYATLAVGDSEGVVEIWNIETGERVSTIETQLTGNWWLKHSLDGQFLMMVGSDNAMMDTTSVFEIASGEQVFSQATPGAVTLFSAISTEADRVLISSFVSETQQRILQQWSLSSGQPLAELEITMGNTASIEFSPEGAEFMIADHLGNAEFRSAETGEVIETWPNQTDRAGPFLYAQNGTSVLAEGANYQPTLFARETGDPIKMYGPMQAPDGFLTSTSGAHFIAVTPNSSFNVFEIESGDLIAQISEVSTSAYWVDVSADGSEAYYLNANGEPQVVSTNQPDIWPASEDRVWTTAALAQATRDELQEQLQVTLPESVTDAQVVRQVAALAYQRGETLLLRDPPWGAEHTPGMHEAPLVQRHAPLLAALTFALIGIGVWLWSAFNMRAYLQRRRPGDPGRVIELFSDTRHQADKVQNAIRRAAKALLQRQPGHERLDIKASIKATAKARGLFTPVEKRDTRMPEYIFLIDARSRADHETQRTLDYLDRLRKEHVPITHYFYERAPDRVRASMGAPSQSLDLIASEHSDKRLVLVGDAASMYASNRTGSGAWKKTLESWQSKSFVTTVPVDEWGIEEEKFTQETGLYTNVLSAEGLEALPSTMFAEGYNSGVPLAPAGALDVPPLPSLMRRDPERWVIESAPDEDEWLDLQSALVGYLSIPGWRWLCACAVYPVIEWDLTVALGQVLTGADEDPLFSESLAARLSELPWMRAGEMPDWLRARLIEEIDHIDREAVRELIAKILEAVDSEEKKGGDTISLKFGYLQGREPDSDERFVDFVTRAPESMDENALLATRKLRELLRPNLLKRLIDPGALGWAVIGLVAAGIAWLIAPRYIGGPSHTGAWIPLLAMLVGPVLAWLAWRGGKRVWRDRPRDASGVFAFPEKVLLWLMTLFGLSGRAARWIDARGRGNLAGTAKLLRRRVEVWTMVPMVLVGLVVGFFAAAIFSLIWSGLYSLNDGWLSAVRNSLIGEIVLSALLIVGLYFAAHLIWRVLRRLYDVTVRLADRASLQRHDLSHQPGGRFSRTLFVVSAFYVALGLAVGADALINISMMLIQSTVLFDQTSDVVVFILFLLILLVIPAWHVWTLRRFANALFRIEQGETVSEPGPAMKAAA